LHGPADTAPKPKAAAAGGGKSDKGGKPRTTATSAAQGDAGELDPRFAKALKDPRFRRAPKSLVKVKVDKRFERMFHDKSFAPECTPALRNQWSLCQASFAHVGATGPLP